MKMKLWKPLLGLVLAAGCFSGCGGGGPETLYKPVAFPNVEYVTGGGTYNLQKMDIQYPMEPTLITEPLNTLLFIHGGNWIGGDKGDYQAFVDDLAKKSGWVVANMNYNTLFQFAYWDDMLEDITSALTVLKAHAESQGVTIKKVALAGHSAGGHLALLYSYREQANSPIPIALAASLAGPADLSDLEMYDAKLTNTIPNIAGGIPFSIGVTFLTKTMEVEPEYIKMYNDGETTAIFTDIVMPKGIWYSSNGVPGSGSTEPVGTLPGLLAAPPFPGNLIKAASPAEYVKPGIPSTLLFQGEKDRIVVPGNSKLLENKLKAAGVEVRRYTYGKSAHTFGRSSDGGTLPGETNVWTDIVKKLVAKLKTIPAE